MKLQNHQIRDNRVIEAFIRFREACGDAVAEIPRLRLSWSSWSFGNEPLEASAERLSRHGVRHMELQGQLYGGRSARETREILAGHGITASGICGIICREAEFASNSLFFRRQCEDYVRRNVEFCHEVGGSYVLFNPSAVGRPNKFDDREMMRAAESIRTVGDEFVRYGIQCAIEPIRKDEVSLCHSFEEASQLIALVDHPGVRNISGDTFHMMLGETHIGETILDYGNRMVNLHLSDSNRLHLGSGMLDLDIVIMALYAAGYHLRGGFCTPEPVGIGPNPYDHLYGKLDLGCLDDLVRQSVFYFKEREEVLLSAEPEELRRRA